MRGQPPMYAKDFIIYDGSKCQHIKYVRAVFPNITGTIFPQTLVIKSIDLSYLPGFMVPP